MITRQQISYGALNPTKMILMDKKNATTGW
jgi:hypothetical protein